MIPEAVQGNDFEQEKQNIPMYRGLDEKDIKKEKIRTKAGFGKAFIFCVIGGLLFFTGYENYRVMREASPEVWEESFLEEAAGEKRERKIKIVLDAGHGGRDTGSSYEGTYEKDINYEFAGELKGLLENMGAEVILSRDGDDFVRETERIRKANDKGADLFISIHCDCGREDLGLWGMECRYDEGGYLGREYANALLAALKQNSEIKCNGISQGDYYVLRNVAMPAVLINLGCLSDSQDRWRLSENCDRDQVIRELAECIISLFYR